MAWTAKLLRLDRSHGRVSVAISYVDSDDNERIDKVYHFERVTKEEIKRKVRREVARLEALKAELLDLLIGSDIDLTEPTPPPDPPPKPPPTAEEIAKRAWFNDWRKLNTLLTLVNAEIIQPRDSRIAPLQVSLRADLLNAYLSDI